MKIPPSRLVFYIFLGGLVPFLAIYFYYAKEKKGWEEVAKHIDTVAMQRAQKSARQANNAAVRERFKKSDPHFVEKLEALEFLTKEKEALKEFISEQTYTKNELFESRYRFLSSMDNHLFFTEKDIQSGEGMRETMEALAKPVEIDLGDLKKILTLVEKEEEGKPQMIITDFILTKKEKFSGTEVLELNFSFIKREFDHEI